MKRLIDPFLQSWKVDPRRKPLILRGARQTGKTFAVRELGKTYENFVEINLERQRELIPLFDYDLNPKRVLSDLIATLRKPIDPKNTLLFIDEIQAAPNALIALRYFYEEMPDMHVIAAGSLLDFAIQEVGVPVGRVSFLYVYPLSFLEFLWAMGYEKAAQEMLHSSEKNPMSPVIHTMLLQLIGKYMAVGGMPEAVKSWRDKQNLTECSKIHANIIDSYRQDFNKYAKNFQLKYVKQLLEYVPKTLGQKFKFSSVPGEFRKRELAPCLDLLETAGIIHKVFHSAGQGIPLGAQANPDFFKVIFVDVALAQTILDISGGDWIINPLEQFVNKGPLVEAFVGQEMLAYADPLRRMPLYYWQREARSAQAEVDYLWQHQAHIVPIEVKSGPGTTLRSLHIFLESHPQSAYGIKFSTHNYSVLEKIQSYPLYAVAKVIRGE